MPPLDHDTIAYGAELEGREHLAGAFSIAIERIRPDPNQPRRDLNLNAQAELAASIERHGILQPITVRYLREEKLYQVITGERRFQAAKALGLPTIPCWIRTPKIDDILIHQIVENWQRRNLQPFELRDALIRLRDTHGHSQKELARLIGKPESEISRLLTIENLDPEVEVQARNAIPGTFTKRHVVALARLDEPLAQQRLAADIEDRRLTAEDTERRVRETKARAVGLKTRGAPLSQRLRYTTSDAIVSLTFRRRNVTSEDILRALDEVGAQIRTAQANTEDA